MTVGEMIGRILAEGNSDFLQRAITTVVEKLAQRHV
jgi:hypothetical protein